MPLTPAYPGIEANIEPQAVTVSIPLVEGERTTTTPEQVVGTADGRPVVAALTVWSRYIPETNVLTLCSKALEHPDATRLTVGHAGAPGEATPAFLTDSVTKLLRNTARAAQDAIVTAAIASDFNAVIVRTPLPELTPEEAGGLQLVYEDGAFKGPYVPGQPLGPADTVQNIESTWYGEIYLTPNTEYFANVIGSSGDPKIAGLSWIQLWQNQFGAATACTSLNFNGFTCGPGLYGGHVILGTVAVQVAAGSNSVFIIPICAAHNNNDNVYMAPLMTTKGISLQNYLH